MKRIIYSIVLIVLLATMASSTPPTGLFEQQTNDLIIISAHPNIVKYQDNVELYFHVYNSSSAKLNNSQTNCSIHLYNISNGVHLYEQTLGKHSTTEWEFVLSNWTVFHTGEYHYIIECANVGLTPATTGFLRNGFVISKTGENITWENYIVGAIVILLPLLLSFLFLYATLALSEEHTVVKIFMSLLSFVSGVFSFALAITVVNKYYTWTELTNQLSIGLWTTGILFFVLLAYWLIYLIRLVIKSIAEAKAERMRY